MNIAEGKQLIVTGAASFTNGTGGKIVTAGNGYLSETGGTFTEGAGTTSGTKPVFVDDVTLAYTGSGASLIALRCAALRCAARARSAAIWRRARCSRSRARAVSTRP